MSMPNFLIIGVEKAGTTALYHALRQHPQIFMSPVKEPCFFAFENQILDYKGPGDSWINQNAIPVLADYQTLFEGAEQIAIGEASPYYMMSGIPSAECISRHIPDAKLILILRHPVDRAYSAFNAMISYGRETLRDFESALNAGEKRWLHHWEPAWRYFENSIYAPQLQQYHTYFDPSQIRIYLYEDWNHSPLSVLEDIYKFLGVSAGYVPDTTTRHNMSRYPGKNRLFQFLTAPNEFKTLGKFLLPKMVRRPIKRSLISRNWIAPPPLDKRTRSLLAQRYQTDIIQVQNIIKRDLRSWLYE